MSEFIRYLLILNVKQMADMAPYINTPIEYCMMVNSGYSEEELLGEKDVFYQTKFYTDYLRILYVAIQKLVDWKVLPESCRYREFLNNNVERPEVKDYYVIGSTDDEESDYQDFTGANEFITHLLEEGGIQYETYEYTMEDFEEKGTEELIEEFLLEFPEIPRTESVNEIFYGEHTFDNEEGADVIIFPYNKCSLESGVLNTIILHLFPCGEMVMIRDYGMLYFRGKEDGRVEGLNFHMGGYSYNLSVILTAILYRIHQSIFKVRIEQKGD